MIDTPFRRLPADRADVAKEIGDGYAAIGRDDAAAERYRHALALGGTMLSAQRALRTVLVRQGRASESLTPASLAVWRAALTRGRDPADWEGFVELAASLGRPDDYRWGCRSQLDQFERADDPAVLEGVGRACLLLPLPPEDLRRATAMIDRAIADELARPRPTWRKPYFLVAKSLAEHRAGRHEVALALLAAIRSGGPDPLPPMPQLVESLCHAATGNRDQALLALDGAAAVDWSPEAATAREQWMFEVLRREAEAAVVPDMPAILAGAREPADHRERIAATAACAAAGRHGLRAKLWEQVLAADAGAGSTRHREMAVVAAAAAGCGRSADVTTDADRARWRGTARRWMREELTAAGAALAEGEQGRARLETTLNAWAACRELAPVRDRDELAKLSSDERAEWSGIWSDLARAQDRARKPRK